MENIYLSNIADYENQEATINGWVYNSRRSGKIGFLSLRDVSGTIQWWIAVTSKPDKISKKNYKKVLEAIPNRLKYFDEQNYDTYPLVCNF